MFEKALPTRACGTQESHPTSVQPAGYEGKDRCAGAVEPLEIVHH
jgi:hypothetical protein